MAPPSNRAARTHDVALLFDAGPRTQALIEGVEARLCELVDVDPVVIAVARCGAIRAAWARLDLAERRRVVRAIIVRSLTVPPVPAGARS